MNPASTRRVTRGAAAFLALGALLACAAACVRRDLPAFEQQLAGDRLRLAYADAAQPLLEGHQALARALPATPAEALAFRLAADGATALTDGCRAETLCDEGSAVFFRLPSGADAPAGLWYFDPRVARLVPLAEGEHSVVRAVPGSGGPWSPRRLAVVRYGFEVRGGTVRATAHRRLTVVAGDYLLPVHLAGRSLVVFEEALGDGRHRLLQVGEDGGEVRPLLADAGIDARYPFALPDGGLAYAAEHDGWSRIHHHDFASGKPRLPTAGATAPAPSAAVRPPLLSYELRDGRPLPVVRRLPEAVDLALVQALVEARHPAINRRRALLAAAVAEAAQLRLALRPTLNLGVFYTPAQGIFAGPVATGDVIAEGIARGVVGLVQPLFEMRRTLALSEAGLARAEVARDLLRDETNQRLAEATEHYLEAQAHRALLAVDDQLLTAAEELVALHDERARAGTASAGDQPAAERERREQQGRRQFHGRLLDLHLEQLRRACALDADQPLVLAEVADAPRVEPPSLDELRQIAYLNQPRLRAAQRTMVEAFFLAQAGSAYAPSAQLGASYGHSYRDFNDSVDDYVSLGLSGSLPTAWFSDRGLQRRRGGEIMAAHRAAQQQVAAGIAEDLHQAWIGWRRAEDQASTQEADARYHEERLRVGRLHQEQGSPDRDRPQTPAMLIDLRKQALLAEGRTIAVRRDCAVALLRVWRETGVLPRADLPAASAARPAASRVSAWAWKPQELLGEAAEAAVRAAGAAGIDRLYVYLRRDAALLAEPASAEQLRRFCALAAGHGIAVWGLLGEPEWVQAPPDELLAGIARIAAFNAAEGTPPLAGLKLDIEPHADPAWREADGPARLTAHWLGLLAAARTALPAGLPLWVDCHPDLLSGATAETLAGTVDGVTLMGYRADQGQIVAVARAAFAAWPKPLEIGIEIRPDAEAGSALPDLDAAGLAQARARIAADLSSQPGFAGLAIHDFSAVLVLPGPPTPSSAP